MKTQRTGVIIFTENFDTLKNFYQEIFEFPEFFDAKWEENNTSEQLVCLDTGSGYILIETPQGKEINPSGPLHLRFNIHEVKTLSEKLKKQKIEHTYTKEPWGENLQLQDPDGNIISIRDEITFLA